MLHGIAIKKEGGATIFGVANATTAIEAQTNVASECGISMDQVTIIPAGEAVSQFGRVAFLVPAEMTDHEVG